MVPSAANASPLLFKAINRAGFAREIGQIQRATNIYVMSFNLLMVVLQAVHETQKKHKANTIVNNLRDVKEGFRDEDGSNPGSNYSELEKAFNNMAKKLERKYSKKFSVRLHKCDY